MQEFLALLRKSGIRQLADVRRYPSSRRHPEYNKNSLEHILAASWVAYRHYEALGGYRQALEGSPHKALDPGLRGYADHTAGSEFKSAVDAVLSWASVGRTAVMCAEAQPAQCHRHLLSDWISVHKGIRVVHIVDTETRSDHNLSALARVENNRIIYDAGRLTLDFEV